MAVRIIFLISVLSLPVMAQRWIGRVELTYSWITYDAEKNIGLPGVGIQLGKEINLKKSGWYIQPEIGLTTRGATIKNGYTSTIETLMLLYADFAAPVKFLAFEKRKTYFLIGPQISCGSIGFLFPTDDRSSRIIYFQNPPSMTVSDEYYAFIEHRLDWGTQLGGGFEFKKFIIDIRYYQGLRKMYDPDRRHIFLNNDTVAKAVNGFVQISLAKPFVGKKSKTD